MDNPIEQLRETVSNLAGGKKRRKEAEEEVVETPEVEETEATEEDRSAFNCPDCQGEGMIFDRVWPEGKLCARCGGTGKI